MSSEIRSPVWMARSSSAWSRRPVQVGLVAAAEQGVDLGLGQVADQRPVEAFGRDRQDPGDAGGVVGMMQGGEPEQGVDRGQAGVAGADAVAAFAFEVIEEAADQRGVEVGDVQRRGCAAGELGGVAEQQPQRVAVGGDGVGAGVALADQPLGEERLQSGGERGHDRPADPAADPAAR